MTAPAHQLTAYQVQKNATILRELAFMFGTGDANPVTFEDWYARFGRDCTRETARKRWVRARRVLEDLSAPIERRPEGRESHLILGPEAGVFAEKMLDAMEKYRQRLKDGNMIDGSRFLLVDMEDIEPPEDYEPNQVRLERMKQSITQCPLGVIHPVILVGPVPPFLVGAGRLRYAACSALGLTTIPARVVDEWDELIRIDEDFVRRHYDQAEVEHLGRMRDQLILEKKAAGKSNRLIAKELGISKDTVRRCAGGAAAPPAHPTITGADGKEYPAAKLDEDELKARRATVRALTEQGMSQRAIARQLRIGETTVRDDLKHPTPEEDEDEDDDLDLDLDDLEDQDWRETDTATAPPWCCLEALDQALAEILDQAEGTDLHEVLREFEELFDNVTQRIRAGEFEYLAPALGSDAA